LRKFPNGMTSTLPEKLAYPSAGKHHRVEAETNIEALGFPHSGDRTKENCVAAGVVKMTLIAVPIPGAEQIAASTNLRSYRDRWAPLQVRHSRPNR
jgi:hypothetical protein